MAQALGRLGRATIAVLLIILLTMAAMFLLGGFWKTGSESSSPTISKIQELGDLVVLRVNVADVLEDDGYEYKGVWIIRGDALVAVDLRLAKLQSEDPEAKKLVMLLPQPRVIQPRVDHEKTTTYDVSKKTWWNPFVGDRNKLTDESMRKAQGIVESTSSGEEVMDQARDQTELLLTNMYRFVGWEIDFVWQEDSGS